MLGISRVAGILQKIYTAGMETGSVPNLGRKDPIIVVNVAWKLSFP
jgi:hypothetical protein